MPKSQWMRGPFWQWKRAILNAVKQSWCMAAQMTFTRSRRAGKHKSNIHKNSSGFAPQRDRTLLWGEFKEGILTKEASFIHIFYKCVYSFNRTTRVDRSWSIFTTPRSLKTRRSYQTVKGERHWERRYGQWWPHKEETRPCWLPLCFCSPPSHQSPAGYWTTSELSQTGIEIMKHTDVITGLVPDTRWGRVRG